MVVNASVVDYRLRSNQDMVLFRLFLDPSPPSPLGLANMNSANSDAADFGTLVRQARERLDAHAYEIVQWHFHESTGCPFWLEKKRDLNFDPLTEVKTFDDLQKFPSFEDEWLRGGPVRRWVPQA